MRSLFIIVIIIQYTIDSVAILTQTTTIITIIINIMIKSFMTLREYIIYIIHNPESITITITITATACSDVSKQSPEADEYHDML